MRPDLQSLRGMQSMFATNMTGAVCNISAVVPYTAPNPTTDEADALRAMMNEALGAVTRLTSGGVFTSVVDSACTEVPAYTTDVVSGFPGNISATLPPLSDAMSDSDFGFGQFAPIADTIKSMQESVQSLVAVQNALRAAYESTTQLAIDNARAMNVTTAEGALNNATLVFPSEFANVLNTTAPVTSMDELQTYLAGFMSNTGAELQTQLNTLATQLQNPAIQTILDSDPEAKAVLMNLHTEIQVRLNNLATVNTANANNFVAALSKAVGPNNSGSGLSTAEIAAIAIGILIVVVGALVLGHKYHKKRKEAAATGDVSDVSTPNPVAGGNGHGAGGTYHAAGADGGFAAPSGPSPTRSSRQPNSTELLWASTTSNSTSSSRPDQRSRPQPPSPSRSRSDSGN